MTKRYFIVRTCSHCGNQEEINVSKREAAFELVDIHTILGPNCGKCNATSFSTTLEKPDLDVDLLKEWATNTDLLLMPQDEDLLLADGQYVDLILEILDHVSVPDQKRNILMEALCVIVYDNSIEGMETDDILKQQVIEALNQRAEKLKQSDKWIMDYIKEVVYPQLTLDDK